MKRKYEPMNSMGPLSAKSTHMPHFLPAPQNFDIPTRVTNSMQPNMTPADLAKLPRPYIRPGACHAHIPSKGGC